MPTNSYTLGTLEASEALIRDLYVDLRKNLLKWSRITRQTPQGRMGYIGQHLASVVTGYPGGRSGARGYDLVLPDDDHAEIKTCNRVDQLGSCGDCGQSVTGIEVRCGACGSDNLERREDSKWLIRIRNDDEMERLFDPFRYYLVLFDFADLEIAQNINARIYAVNPRLKGFAYCMVDYYFNIWPGSTAPFNLWPFQLKFDIMRGTLIYHAEIYEDNSIDTHIFPEEVGEPQQVRPAALPSYHRSRNLTKDKLPPLAESFGVDLSPGGTKREWLETLEEARVRNSWPDEDLADEIAETLYGEEIEGYMGWLPDSLEEGAN